MGMSVELSLRIALELTEMISDISYFEKKAS